MNFSNEIFIQIISFAFIVIVVFLALRAFVLWYWRVGEMANSLLEINKNIKLLLSPTPEKMSNKNMEVASSIEVKKSLN